jgi:hypothetical protein
MRPNKSEIYLENRAHEPEVKNEAKSESKIGKIVGEMRERETRNPLCLWSSPSFFLPPAAGNRVTREILGQQTISPGPILSAYYLPFAQLGELTFSLLPFCTPHFFEDIFLWRIFAILLEIF